ncbi:hypothetical protein [Microbacterium sp. KNMS]
MMWGNIRVRLKSPEEKYREQRQKEILAHYDKWVVYAVNVNGQAAYIATPLWDDEWLLTRDSFPTAAEAVSVAKREGATFIREEPIGEHDDH